MIFLGGCEDSDTRRRLRKPQSGFGAMVDEGPRHGVTNSDYFDHGDVRRIFGDIMLTCPESSRRRKLELLHDVCSKEGIMGILNVSETQFHYQRVGPTTRINRKRKDEH